MSPTPGSAWARRWARTGLATVGALVTSTLGILAQPIAAVASPVNGAAFTTVDESVDGTGHCKNGNPQVNCNIYDGKKYVWMNGGPVTGQIGDGTYFFAVLDPGGQADPNDGAASNLSSPFDAYTNRTFSLSGGSVSYSGTHDFDSANNLVRLLPYANTTNPGGVYIMAICSLDEGYPVDPSGCKYDAFKVQGSSTAPLTVSKDANGSYTDTFTWGIQKSVDTNKVIDPSGSATFHYTVNVTHDGGTVGNVKVTGTIEVFNPNVDDNNDTLAVSSVDVTDTLSDGTTCSVTNGSNQTLTAAKTEFAYSCSLGSLPAGQLDNTVTATWPQQVLADGSGFDGGSADFTFSSIAFKGTNVDDCVSVSDTLGGSLGTVCSTDPSPTTFTYPYTVTGTPGTCVTQNNTATLTTNSTGSTASSSQSVQLCTPEDLGVTKNAAPGFFRTYNWKIAKSADKTLVEQLGGGTATVTYKVTVTQTGYTDSGWHASGLITLTNPNDFFDFTGVNVTDAVDNGGICVVTGGTNVTVPKSSSVNLPYSCTYASQPAYRATATNTATATWDGTSLKTPDSTASGQASFSFNNGTSGNPSETNKCVTITDSVAGALGTDCVGTDPANKTFTYQRSLTVPASSCVTYPNTAIIKETGQTASASVEVCGPAKTGALTMGFWQNKNGQAIISGGSSTGGICNSGTWLRQYTPFQDLGSTASCAQVATYAYNVIKAANASGSTMNAMLKAQMLATALDVYFSNPALGGNKITATAPIGGVSIDLTKICQMIDSSSGTGNCGGSFENTNPAFGGAHTLTVSQMLAYAASQLSGSTWYGNVKATQQLAKDAFDAVNNGVAFSP